MILENLIQPWSYLRYRELAQGVLRRPLTWLGALVVASLVVGKVLSWL